MTATIELLQRAHTNIGRLRHVFAREVHIALIAAALVSGLVVAGCATAQSAPEAVEGDSAAGQAYASAACAECHNVTARHFRILGTFGAPDFYAVANAKTTTGTGLTVFLTTPHARMPNLIIKPEDRRNVIAYILSLRRGNKPESNGV
jgi:mono/diheme cytochrome c family protein